MEKSAYENRRWLFAKSPFRSPPPIPLVFITLSHAVSYIKYKLRFSVSVFRCNALESQLGDGICGSQSEAGGAPSGSTEKKTGRCHKFICIYSSYIIRLQTALQ